MFTRGQSSQEDPKWRAQPQRAQLHQKSSIGDLMDFGLGRSGFGGNSGSSDSSSSPMSSPTSSFSLGSSSSFPSTQVPWPTTHLDFGRSRQGKTTDKSRGYFHDRYEVDTCMRNERSNSQIREERGWLPLGVGNPNEYEIIPDIFSSSRTSSNQGLNRKPFGSNSKQEVNHRYQHLLNMATANELIATPDEGGAGALSTSSSTSAPAENMKMTKLRPFVTNEDGCVSPGSDGYSSASSPVVINPNGRATPTNIDEELVKLSDDTEYQIVQRNGQRIYGGPPPGWEGNPPLKGTEIFVGKVPRDCYENELVPLFSTCGTIYEMRLMMDFSGSNRGYLFVLYSSKAEAKKAIEKLNNYEIRPGKYIGVVKSVDNRKLWISGIPKNRTAEEIKYEMEKQTEGVINVILCASQTDKSKTRGYAFVEYETHRAAALARRKLVPGRVYILGHEIEKVDWAEPENDVDEDIMSKVKILFVRNLTPDTTEDQINDYFQELGGGEKLERVKKAKDFAFVHFQTREAAELAFNKCQQDVTLNGSLLDVGWSKPVDKNNYNLRKEMTKALTTGAPPSTAIYQTNPFEHNPMTGMGPRYTFASRGGPGTVPPRGLVQRLAAANNLRGMNGVNKFNLNGISGLELANGGISNPIHFLQYLCDHNGWGDPIFNTYSNVNRSGQCASSTIISGSEILAGRPPKIQTQSDLSKPAKFLFTCRVKIPNFVLPYPKNTFISSSLRADEAESRKDAALLVFEALGLPVGPDHNLPKPPHQQPHHHQQQQPGFYNNPAYNMMLVQSSMFSPSYLHSSHVPAQNNVRFHNGQHRGPVVPVTTAAGGPIYHAPPMQFNYGNYPQAAAAYHGPPVAPPPPPYNYAMDQLAAYCSNMSLNNNQQPQQQPQAQAPPQQQPQQQQPPQSPPQQ